MEVTREMVTQVDNDVESYTNELLIIYNNTYTNLNKIYPNSLYQYMVERSLQELKKRGLGT